MNLHTEEKTKIKKHFPGHILVDETKWHTDWLKKEEKNCVSSFAFVKEIKEGDSLLSYLKK